VIEEPSATEHLWRAFEDEAICSPYQRFDWLRAFVEAFADEEGFTVRILLMRDEVGRTLMLLPLALRRQCGFTVASLVGSKQANYHLPVFAPGLGSTLAAAMPRALREVARSLGIDAYAFEHVPLVWGKDPNPLLAGITRPSPSNAYKLELQGNPEATLGRIGKSEWRRKLRKKEKALAEKGDLQWRVARTPSEIVTVLDCFFKQKADRFTRLGIPNPFASEASRRFLRMACLASSDKGFPAIELHGLWLDERLIATFGGAADRRRISCMFNSFDPAPHIARYSPGDILLTKVIAAQHGLGRTAFDLGVGEARYKTTVCDLTDELRDVFLPVTAKGWLYVAARTQLSATKRLVKQTSWGRQTVRLVRTARAKLGA
jgi:CelD/BcsL family acetyltransferase involved in cellulose biosynthesis